MFSDNDKVNPAGPVSFSPIGKFAAHATNGGSSEKTLKN
jgi:hypothetical protein